jgi:hypothetical protein
MYIRFITIAFICILLVCINKEALGGIFADSYRKRRQLNPFRYVGRSSRRAKERQKTQELYNKKNAFLENLNIPQASKEAIKAKRTDVC